MTELYFQKMDSDSSGESVKSLMSTQIKAISSPEIRKNLIRESGGSTKSKKKPIRAEDIVRAAMSPALRPGGTSSVAKQSFKKAASLVVDRVKQQEKSNEPKAAGLKIKINP